MAALTSEIQRLKYIKFSQILNRALDEKVKIFFCLSYRKYFIFYATNPNKIRSYFWSSFDEIPTAYLFDYNAKPSTAEDSYKSHTGPLEQHACLTAGLKPVVINWLPQSPEHVWGVGWVTWLASEHAQQG